MTPGSTAALIALAAAPGDYGSGAMVGFFDAAKLSEACAADVRAVDARAICLGYIAGVTDQLLAAQAARGGPPAICIPSDAAAGKVVGVVAVYAAWTPQAKGVSAAGFVEAALEQAYPCRPSAEPM